MFWKKSKVEQIEAKTLKEWMDQNRDMIILDVRTEDEWKQTGIVPGSMLVPNFKLIQQMQQGLDLDRGKPVIIVCRSGNRSLQVAEYLDRQGIEAINLKNGIIGWYRQAYKIERI